MNPKCPWCGNQIRVTWDNRGATPYCPSQCFMSMMHFKTKKQALDAASKRFMPKRSVEEIENFVRNENDRRIEYIKQVSEAGESNEVINSIANLGHATMATRIADFIYGVTE